MTFGAFGSYNRIVTINSDLTVINCGYFSDDYESFKKAVIVKYGIDYGSYKMLIFILESIHVQLKK